MSRAENAVSDTHTHTEELGQQDSEKQHSLAQETGGVIGAVKACSLGAARALLFWELDHWLPGPLCVSSVCCNRELPTGTSRGTPFRQASLHGSEENDFHCILSSQDSSLNQLSLSQVS